MKEPKAFNSAEIVAILNGASTATGDDFPRAFRVMKEIKSLPEYSLDAQKRPQILIKEEIFLHLKPADLPAMWKWIKAYYIGDGKRLTPMMLEGLAEIAVKLGQGEDYDSLVEDMTTEEEDKIPAIPVAEAAHA